jgi:hypothetical protein
MEYVIGVLDHYKIDTKLIKNSSDLSPLRLLFNEVIVAIALHPLMIPNLCIYLSKSIIW